MDDNAQLDAYYDRLADADAEAQARKGHGSRVALGDRVIVRGTGGLTGYVVHLYTNDSGERVAFVRMADGHKARYLVASLTVTEEVSRVR